MDQQTDGIIASSLFLILCKYFATKTDNKFADDPELTITAYLDPKYLANSFSNLAVIADMVSCWVLITFCASLISDLLNAFSSRG